MTSNLSVPVANDAIESTLLAVVVAKVMVSPVATSLVVLLAAIISAEEALEALQSSDVLVIGTECPEFRDQVHRIPNIYLNRQLLVLDPSHYLEKDLLANQFEGLHYVTVGSNFYGKSFNE